MFFAIIQQVMINNPAGMLTMLNGFRPEAGRPLPLSFFQSEQQTWRGNPLNYCYPRILRYLITFELDSRQESPRA
ncbi:hypothetical protein NB703_004417 [Pantoea ananatis]|uniref:Uncharacterized protein n=1 Tax=Pantoea ananas TaxID=553 RepID=A0AAJ1D300_PANAN|nr:hypothetical protein [Pantoea ananatis]MCW0408117.1 hypothetical protein [Pantoea ananatis]MCW0428320.1 hypothetical protein [Pantoea ananatis]